MRFEDNDIKIASSHPARDQHLTAVSGENGEGPSTGVKLAEARGFGRDTAVKMLRAEKKLAPVTDDAAISLQYKILFAFAVAAGLELYSRGTNVFRAALNAFYDKLREIDREFYNDLDSTGAFSFYYLEFRRGRDVPGDIGRVFAMLCGRDGDLEQTALGTSLYLRFLRFVEGEIRAAGLEG